MEGFWLSLGLVFLAELGDKTQLVALTLATRFRAGVVLAGVLVATLAVHLLSVAMGGLTGAFLSTAWIEFCRDWPLWALPSGPSGATDLTGTKAPNTVSAPRS